ncbi:MAG: T9SS type A sorting domain-containing protein, partial [Candidatus Delongbacteria bacterium]
EFKFLYDANPVSNIGVYAGNIDSDPLFLDEWNGDYFLTENSPCINAGTESIPDSISFPEYDLAGNMRIYGATIDIGAYEWQSVGIENSTVPLSTKLYQNYPNPFNPVTTISYALSEAAEVELNIYNMNGQIVRSLVNGKVDSGIYRVQFNADNLASGLYVYKLKVDGKFVQSRKMMLLK